MGSEVEAQVNAHPAPSDHAVLRSALPMAAATLLTLAALALPRAPASRAVVGAGAAHLEGPVVAAGTASTAVSGIELVAEVGGAYRVLISDTRFLYAAVGRRIVIYDIDAGDGDDPLAVLGPFLRGVTSLTSDGELLLAATGRAGMQGALHVIAIGNGADARLLSSTQMRWAANGLAMHAGWAWLAQGPHGVVAYDLADPAAPVQAPRLVPSLADSGRAIVVDVLVVGDQLFLPFAAAAGPPAGVAPWQPPDHVGAMVIDAEGVPRWLGATELPRWATAWTASDGVAWFDFGMAAFALTPQESGPPTLGDPFLLKTVRSYIHLAVVKGSLWAKTLEQIVGEPLPVPGTPPSATPVSLALGAEAGGGFGGGQPQLRLLAAGAGASLWAVHDESLLRVDLSGTYPRIVYPRIVGKVASPARRFEVVEAAPGGAWAIGAEGTLWAVSPEGGITRAASQPSAPHSRLAAAGDRLVLSVPDEGVLHLRGRPDDPAGLRVEGSISGLPVTAVTRTIDVQVSLDLVMIELFAEVGPGREIYVACWPEVGGVMAPARRLEPGGNGSLRDVAVDGDRVWLLRTAPTSLVADVEGWRADDACRMAPMGERMALGSGVGGLLPTMLAMRDQLGAVTFGNGLALLDARANSSPRVSEVLDLPGFSRGIALDGPEVWLSWRDTDGGLLRFARGVGGAPEPIGDVIAGRIIRPPAVGDGTVWLPLADEGLGVYRVAGAPATATKPKATATVTAFATATAEPTRDSGARLAMPWLGTGRRGAANVGRVDRFGLGVVDGTTGTTFLEPVADERRPSRPSPALGFHLPWAQRP